MTRRRAEIFKGGEERREKREERREKREERRGKREEGREKREEGREEKTPGDSRSRVPGLIFVRGLGLVVSSSIYYT